MPITSMPIFTKDLTAKTVKSNLSEHNKKILEEFMLERAMSVKDGIKLRNIERHILKFYLIIKKDLDTWNKEDVAMLGIMLNNYKGSFWVQGEMITYLKLFIRKFYKNYEILSVLDKIKRTSKRIDDTKINENNLITAEELERMVRKAENFRQKALLLLLWESGARPQEILDLKWKDVNLEGEHAILNLYSKKTSRNRSFPLNEAGIHLKRWKQEYCYPNVKPNDYIFPGQNDRSKRLTDDGLNKFLRTIAERAGIQKKIWAYLFRHSRATALYEELPTPIVEQLMGHKDMYQVYAHISSKKAREELINKVYHTEELSPEKKTALEKDIAELQKIDEIQRKEMKQMKSKLDYIFENAKTLFNSK